MCMYILLYLSVYHILFIHSSVDGQLGCFHVLAIVNNAVWTLGCVYLFKLEFLSFLDICPGVGLLDYMVTLFLVFLRNLHIILHSGHTNLHFQQCKRISFFSALSHSLHLRPFIICRLFDDGHSDWCDVIPHYGFDLHFSNN